MRADLNRRDTLGAEIEVLADEATMADTEHGLLAAVANSVHVFLAFPHSASSGVGGVEAFRGAWIERVVHVVFVALRRRSNALIAELEVFTIEAAMCDPHDVLLATVASVGSL